ncbi:hypothetical protein AAES_97025 [Amazona aestiva]|uniref:Uncharacterized protein n=1 Tax=Amazona aestiva TaxID=12930 RepID=A0A0Q3MCE0_AMAAE|nr:hypothetical protein AAES_97025 [Amazona aestiva]
MLRVIYVETQTLLMAEEFTGSWVKPGRYLLGTSGTGDISPVELAGEKGNADVLEVSWTLERYIQKPPQSIQSREVLGHVVF